MPGNATLAPSLVPVTATLGVDTVNCGPAFEASRVFVVAVYCAVFALGLPANCLTAWLTLLQALQGNVLAIYLFCLALCELLYAGTLPLWAIYVHNQHRWTLGPGACKVTGYIFFCNLYVSVLFLCCVSCDRFVAVVYALESRGRRRPRTAVLVCVAVFLLVGLAHYPVFQMDDRETCFETAPLDSQLARYSYLRFAGGFAGPLGVIAFTNHRIFYSVGRSRGLSAAQKARVKRTAVAVVAIFSVCFAPYHLVLLAKAAAFSYYGGERGPQCAFETRLCTTSVVFLCLSTVNSVADPIIYVLATDHSRQEVSRLHRRWRERRALHMDVAQLTGSRGSDEAQTPTSTTPGCVFPLRGASPCAPERLGEETC